MVESIADRPVINPYERYSGYDWHDTNILPPPPVQKGLPPGPLYETTESLAGKTTTTAQNFSSNASSSYRGPKLSPPKGMVTADVSTREWYEQMRKLAERAEGTDGKIETLVGESEYAYMKRFFDTCNERSHLKKECQSIAAAAIIKDQGVHREIRKKLDDHKEKHASIGNTIWALEWLGWLLSGATLIVGGAAVVSMIASGAGLAGAGAVGNAAYSYAMAALSLANASASATRLIYKEKSNAHMQAKEELNYRSGKAQKKIKGKVEEIKKDGDKIFQDIEAKKKMLDSHHRASQAVIS